MGVDSRSHPPLPAPTETDSNTEAHHSFGTEVESRLTEKSQYTLPEDGSPVTIATRRKKDGHGLNSNKSQTSLLIEYFEGGKGSEAESRRPSVRVKVTPSSKSRHRSTNDHIQITERTGTRKPSYSKRISLTPNTRDDKLDVEGDDISVNSYRSATEESNVTSNVTSRGGGPIEVEIMPRRHGSPLIPTGAPSSSKYVQHNQSEISSMPADSFLDGHTRSPERKRSRSLTKIETLATGAAAGLDAGAVADKLRTPSRRRSRSLSRERVVAQKAVEKVRGDKSERRRKHRSRSRSVSGEQLETLKSPRRRSSRSHHDESLVSGVDSSLLNSHVSGRSGDAYSFRSGTSKSSINNPKLLETVEDAIRRLILPELTALKREQSKRHDRDRDRRSSITSGSGISRDSRDNYSSTRGLSERGSGTDLSARPKVILNDTEVLSGNTIKGRKDKNIDRVKLSDSPKVFERETSAETIVHDGDVSRKKRSSDRSHNLETAAIGAGIGALTASALHKHQSEETLEGERKERRRRRTKSRSRSGSLAEAYDEQTHQEVPPMPLMSEINASDLTRTSILSAETDRPHSASQELITPIQEVSRGFGSPSSRTPTRTPVALKQGLTQHSNYSRGNLSLHSQVSDQQLRSTEYEIDEHGRKVPMSASPRHSENDMTEEEHDSGRSRMLAAGLAGAGVGAGVGAGLASLQHHDDEDDHEDSELMEDESEHGYYPNNQEVPHPLRYVPYAQERRGLSPIQSVSGYTEGDPEPTTQRDSRLTQSTGSYSSLNKSPHHRRSRQSLDSTSNVQANQHDFQDVRTGGLTESELTQDGEYWEEQHRENDRNRDIDSESHLSSNPNTNYEHSTRYEERTERPQLDRISTGQTVKGVGANPDYVHTPLAVESAVASLVNSSELTGVSGYSGNNAQYDRRGSYASFEDGSERNFTSRGNSPTKREVSRDVQYEDSEVSSLHNSPTKFADEYELDEQGRKVAKSTYGASHPAEKAIAASAAAAVLASRTNNSTADQIQYHDRLEDTGAPLHRSFKARALDGHGQMPSPRQSVDGSVSEAMSHEQLKMGASGIPDQYDPMPEIGYGDEGSDVTTNPSIIQGPIGGTSESNREHWPNQPSPQPHYVTARSSRSRISDANLKAAEAALIGAAAGLGGAAAIASHGHHSREQSQDHDEEWRRTSSDRKRDTLITNPYEGTSPVAAIGEGLDRDLLPHGSYQGLDGGFIPTKLDYQNNRAPPSPRDEGYISSAPNNTRSVGGLSPEPRAKGVGFMDQDIGGAADALNSSDPFYTPKHARHHSGMSHGMGSPIYDSATGQGIDRIQSKDIVALMDHLTVRDAQRSARDTEILVTLVRAAAEMRNSFEDMKRLLADTEDVIITEVQSNTDKSVQKVINGPRPPPASAPRSLRQGSQDEMYDDIPNKKRNVFRRALKGLSMKSSNDLGKIEDMLVQLLGEVEGLKVAQGLKPNNHPEDSYDDFHQEGNYENDRGYEPEGNAGTSTASHASQSGHLSIPQSRGVSGSRPFDNRKFSDHRISTVPEGDEEELDAHEEAVLHNQFEHNELLLTPTRDVRAGSAPVGTPPQQNVAPASLSNENTSRTDKSKKHKSSSSSGWIPKVSRWSETTASTVLRGFRSSKGSAGRKDEQYATPPSRSGSNLGDYGEHDPYGDDKIGAGHSQDQLEEDYDDQETPMSLLPPEDPKYKAHRNSLNLQHPQPRPGPTVRYQTALEVQAVDFNTPMSPKTIDWGSTTSLNRLPPQQTNRYSDNSNHTGRISPVSDGGYSNASASNQAPQRPPKEPLAPERPSKISNKLTKPSPLSKEHLASDMTTEYQQGSSPKYAPRAFSESLTVPVRKPTGPRSMSSASKSGGALNREDGTVIRRNVNRDTFGTIASNHSGESETF